MSSALELIFSCGQLLTGRFLDMLEIKFVVMSCILQVVPDRCACGEIAMWCQRNPGD